VPDDQRRLYYPEYGTVASLAGLVPVVAAAGPVTDVVAARAPTLPVGVLAAMALWGLLGVVLLGEYRRQAAANPRTFESRGARTRFCREGTPGQRRLLLAVTLFLVGGLLATAFWPTYLDAAERVARALVALPEVPGGTVWGDALELVLFGVVYGGFARGADWVVVGLARMLIHRNLAMRGR